MGAFLVGVAKTAVGGLGTVAVALFAAVLPARESTAAVLLLLVVGDVCAVAAYRRDADWSLLRQVVPGVLPGLVVGTLVLAVVGDSVLRVGIAMVILLLVAMQLWLAHHRPRDVPLAARDGPEEVGGSPWATRAGTGIVAGFTTMVANAAGPVMTLYLVAQGVDKRRFLGTSAWFFFGVNLCKLPFSAGLGLFRRDLVLVDVVLVPLVLLGAWAGVHVAHRLGQRSFERVVLVATAVSGLGLLAR